MTTGIGKRLSRGSMIALVGVLVAMIALVAWPVGLHRWVHCRYQDRVFSLDDVPSRDVALVFGAGLWADGSPTPVLADRVHTAAELYHAGKVRILLMSGDNSRSDYNEPQAMLELAVASGVPPDAVVLDYAGRRTYDSCYRAVHIFGVEEAILVTQAFHLDRALYIADHLGIDAVGVPADKRSYLYIRQYRLREIAATWAAWWDLNVLRPLPILGPREMIPALAGD
ncbi:MAG: SanA/YdcF family protein [Anaerolineae bacterium]